MPGPSDWQAPHFDGLGKGTKIITCTQVVLVYPGPLPLEERVATEWKGFLSSDSCHNHAGERANEVEYVETLGQFLPRMLPLILMASSVCA